MIKLVKAVLRPLFAAGMLFWVTIPLIVIVFGEVPLVARVVGSYFWTGFYYMPLQSYSMQTAIQQDPLVEARFYAELSEWNQCATIYKEHLLDPLLGVEPKESSVVLHDAQFDRVHDGLECLMANGHYEHQVSVTLLSIHPLNSRQESIRNNLLAKWRRTLEFKDQRKKAIDVAVEFLQNQSFHTSSSSSSTTVDPMHYLRGYRVLLLLIIWAYSSNLQRNKHMSNLQWYKLWLACTLTMAWNETHNGHWAVFANVLLLWGMGVKRFCILYVLTLSLLAPLEASSTSTLGFHCLYAGSSTAHAEQARLAFLQYPYHPADVERLKSFELLTKLLKGRKHQSCQSHPSVKNPDCKFMKDAARTLVSMSEEVENDGDTLAGIVKEVMDSVGWPPVPANFVQSVPQEIRYRADQGMVGNTLSAFEKVLNKSVPIIAVRKVESSRRMTPAQMSPI